MAGTRVLCPTAHCQTPPPSPPFSPQACGAAPGHDSPVRPPQSRAGARSSRLEGPHFPLASPRISPAGPLPRCQALCGSVGACSAPGPSPHLVPSSPMDPPRRGAGDPPRPWSRATAPPGAGWRPLCCLVLRRGHPDLSSGKTPSSMPSPAPSVWF